MELDRITLIDRALLEVMTRIADAGFGGTIDQDALVTLSELSDERVRLTEPVLELSN